MIWVHMIFISCLIYLGSSEIVYGFPPFLIFFSTYQEKSQALAIGTKIEELIQNIQGASIEQSRWIKDEGAYRIWCYFLTSW